MSWCCWYHFIHTTVFVLYFSHISKLWYMLKAAFVVLFCSLFAYYSIIGSVSSWSCGCDFRHQVWREHEQGFSIINITWPCLAIHSRFCEYVFTECPWMSHSGQCADAASWVTSSLWLHPLLSHCKNARVPERCDCMCRGCDWILWGAKCTLNLCTSKGIHLALPKKVS